MARLAALLAALASCVHENELVTYDCKLIYACGEVGLYYTIAVVGTIGDVQETADGWVEACALLTRGEVSSARCTSVYCGAICEAR